MILFPAIDLKDGQCVRLRQGEMAEATVFNTDPAVMDVLAQTSPARSLFALKILHPLSGRCDSPLFSERFLQHPSGHVRSETFLMAAILELQPKRNLVVVRPAAIFPEHVITTAPLELGGESTP